MEGMLFTGTLFQRILNMKHLKQYKLFENTNVDWLKELFANLQDEGFNISISDNISYRKINFPKSNKATTLEIDRLSTGKSVIVTEVEISKVSTWVWITNRFIIDDVIDTIIQSESYLKGELNSKIECIYVVDTPRYTYYKGISDLPRGQKIDKITVAFSKI